jgi:AraC-like DNA-binding protein
MHGTTTPALVAQVAALVARAADASVVSPLPGLVLVRNAAPTELSPTLYEPVVCLVLQGRKETTLGGATFDVGPGQSLLVSHDVPVVARITEARPEAPYLAVVLRIDIDRVRSLADRIGGTNAEPARSVVVHETDPRLLEGVSRYLRLADDVVGDPIEAKVMAPLLLEEIHFRLLMAPHGCMLRELVRHDSRASHIGRAIARIRRDFRTPLSVPELARSAAMSESAFYKHFREITASTPLQYQKDLRLLEARRLLSTGEHSVSTAAFEVGYESPSQFSREYTRKFGVPPSAHLRAAS